MRSNKILIGIPISIFLIYIFFEILATAKIKASKDKPSIETIPTIPYQVDKILGQPDDKQTMTNRIVANRGFHMGGVHVDSQDRIYVVD